MVPKLNTSLSQAKCPEIHLSPLYAQWERETFLFTTPEGYSEMKVGLYLSYCLYGVINVPVIEELPKLIQK